MRTIEIRHSDHEAYCNHFNENTGRMTEALGYLTTWAPTAYQYVDIYVALDGEMTACYWRNKAAFDANERPGGNWCHR